MIRFEYIPIEDCVHRGYYKLMSRNLLSGVYDEDRKAFVGIREKWDSRFLDCEFHYDTGPPHGTAWPVEFLEETLPAEIDTQEHLSPDRDQVTGRPVAFDKPIRIGGRGWYFLDTGESSEEIKAVLVYNDALYDWLTYRISNLRSNP